MRLVVRFFVLLIPVVAALTISLWFWPRCGRGVLAEPFRSEMVDPPNEDGDRDDDGDFDVSEVVSDLIERVAGGDTGGDTGGVTGGETGSETGSETGVDRRVVRRNGDSQSRPLEITATVQQQALRVLMVMGCFESDWELKEIPGVGPMGFDPDTFSRLTGDCTKESGCYGVYRDPDGERYALTRTQASSLMRMDGSVQVPGCLNVEQENELEAARREGRSDLMTTPLPTLARSLLELDVDGFARDFFGDGRVSFQPPRESRLLRARDPSTTVPIVWGASNGGGLLAGAKDTLRLVFPNEPSWRPNGFRALVFGCDVISMMNSGDTDAFREPFDRMFDWLITGSKNSSESGTRAAVPLGTWASPSDARPDPSGSRVMVAGMRDYAHELRRYRSDLEVCEAECDASLLIVGVDPGVQGAYEAVREAIIRYTPVLYVHRGGASLSEEETDVLKLLGFDSPESNYWVKTKAQWRTFDEMLDTCSEDAAVSRFASRVASCTSDCFPPYDWESEVQRPLRRLRVQLATCAREGIDVFSVPWLADCVLLGDHLRVSISSYKDGNSTHTARNLFCDYSAFCRRFGQPEQGFKGGFSSADLSGVSTETVSVTLSPRRPFVSTGTYAIPGNAFVATLRRGSATLFINCLSDRAVSFSRTRHARTEGEGEGEGEGQGVVSGNYGYDRPALVTSQKVPLKVGVPITLSWPYGGIVFASCEESSEIELSGVARHPVWRDGDRNGGSGGDGVTKEAFVETLSTTPFDWCEFLTERFEIHSTVSNMLRTLEDVSSLTTMASALQRHHYGGSLALSGYTGHGVPAIEEVADWATSRGFTLKEVDGVQHMVADRVACPLPGGCRGNPYSDDRPFRLAGTDDLLSVPGYNRLSRFDSHEPHTEDALFVYYTQQQASAAGLETDCEDVDWEWMLEKLRDSVGNDNPEAFFRSHTKYPYSDWQRGVVLMTQALMLAQQRAAVSDGWSVLARLHVFRNNLLNTVSSPTWPETRVRFLMTDYSAEEASEIPRNDLLLIALTECTGYDYTEFFDMWGIRASSKARAQVDSAGYPTIGRSFIVSNGYACGPWTELQDVQI